MCRDFQTCLSLGGAIGMPMSMNPAGRLTPLKDWSFGGVEKECSRA